MGSCEPVKMTGWLASHPGIKVVTCDGSQSYAAIISAASEFIRQVSDRFHLMQNLKDTHPEVEHIIQICIGFRKMLHAEDDAPCMDDWLKDAIRCKIREIRSFALCVRKDKEVVIETCSTNYSNALLEGTVNKTKAIKKSMFNRANADVLRTKLLYSGMKWDRNYHPN